MGRPGPARGSLRGGTSPPRVPGQKRSPRLRGERSHHLFPWHERPSNSVQTLPSHRKAQTHWPRHLPSRPLGHTLFWEPRTPLAFHFRCPCSPAWGFPICRTRHQSSFSRGPPHPTGCTSFVVQSLSVRVCPAHWTGNFWKGLCLLLPHVLRQSPEQLFHQWTCASRACKHRSGPQDTCLGRSFVRSFTHSFIQWNLSGWGLWLPHRG